ncbi:MAG: helix-turn-helix domain-containing protein [Candidatus Marinimicrobia bacterium]|nr:helix-turn-helix domain-containing protein [Candidatus Neomarinimicrobiota bacterium]MBT7373678.1 helix-turn-helix domain-containing protein [Candidatus Neomarinimicrobiota bacterium]
MDTNSLVDKKIQLLMHHLGVHTYDALAKELGVTQPAISQWTTAERGIPKKILIKYADVLDDAYSADSSADSKDEIIALQKKIIGLQEEIIRLKDK